jgi:serine/threonine protein phosphatase PrpC
MAEKIICPNCNTPNQKDDRFCLECGRPLRGEQTVQLEGLSLSEVAEQASGKPVRTGTKPLTASPGFLPRPIKAIFGDRFLGNNHIHSDDHRHGYLVTELSDGGRRQITQCSNPECGAIHVPLEGELESFCSNCRAPLTADQLGLVLFEAQSQIFGSAGKIGELGLTHPGIRAPLVAFKESIGKEDRFCLVIPYVEPLPSSVERNQVFQWGSKLASALAYLHHNGVTFNGKISDSSFNLANGRAVIANFYNCQILESVDSTARVADVQALATVLFKWLTGRTQYAHDPGLSPVINSFFETALQPPGFSSAELFAQTFEEAQRQTATVRPVEHKLGKRTDVGVARNLNEDSLFALQFDKYLESVPYPMGVYVVADGMGGHSAGEVASGTIVNIIAEKAVSEFMTSPENNSPEQICEWIVSAMQAANKAVYELSRKMRSDMGSTTVMAAVTGNTACIGHVGDSRAYMINDQGITRLTTDHSLVERLVATGQITREEARHHPQRNVIYRTMGDKIDLEVDTSTHQLHPGDRLLLCSDGLNGMVDDDTMREIVLVQAASPQDACDKLVQAANAAGGDDNITVVVLEVV